MNAVGTNTAHSTSAMAISAPATSSIAGARASSGDRPCVEIALDVLDHDDRVVDDDADRQHQAEQRQVVEREADSAMTANVPISDTGMATIGMIAARQLCRNRITTTTTSADRLEQRVHDLVDRLRMNSVGL